MFAPMSLTTYEEARPWLRAIKQRVSARTMPPWGSDMPHGIFKNDPRLSEKEVETIVSWVDGGAPKGDMKDMPKLPEFVEGWTIGKPDAIFSMTEDYTIAANGAIEYQYVRIPVNLPEDRWIQAIEIRPGDRAQVHHVIAFTQPSDEPTRPAAARADQHRRRQPNKPGVVFDPGVTRLLRGHSRDHSADALHDQRQGSDRPHAGRHHLRQAAAAEDAAGGMVLQPRFVIPANAATPKCAAPPRSRRTRS